ncbi:MAG: RluA family pseudouridine synthase [Clostridia bacterium]|nr:RluA family pseudouridine synthase [Clostridia bacterium]
MINVTVSGVRLDKYLQENFPDFSRSQIKKSIDLGQVTVNGEKVKAGYELKVGDRIEYVLEDTKTITAKPQEIDIDIVYEDDDIIVINKAQGMVVHPAVGNREGTLVNALLYKTNSLSNVNGDIRPGIVHRIDKDTSGLLVVAKNDKAHKNLSEQISSKTCKRYYFALLQGVLKDSQGEIITNIGRDPKNRLKMSVLPADKGKIAHTLYKVIKYYKGYSFCEFELKTGRTHQIRVHSAYLRHAIVGDSLYNNNPCKFKLNGQLLHAYKLVLVHPTTNKEMVFEAPIPTYFQKVLDSLEEI